MGLNEKGIWTDRKIKGNTVMVWSIWQCSLFSKTELPNLITRTKSRGISNTNTKLGRLHAAKTIFSLFLLIVYALLAFC